MANFTRTPFIKPPDLVREFTAMPRAIVNFELTNSVLTAKPVNDQAELIITIQLPVEFAYRWISLNVSVIQDVAFDWNGSYIEITNGVRGLALGATQRWSTSKQNVDKIPTLNEMWIAFWNEKVMPTDILQARDGNAVVMTYKASNRNVAVGAAGTANCLFSFYEYDIEQAQRFPLHYATQVYSRN